MLTNIFDFCAYFYWNFIYSINLVISLFKFKLITRLQVGQWAVIVKVRIVSNSRMYCDNLDHLLNVIKQNNMHKIDN